MRLAPLCFLAFGASPLAAAQDGDDPLAFGGEGRSLRFEPFVQVDVLAAEDTDGLPAQSTDLNLARLYVTGEAGDLSGTLAYEFQDAGGWRYAYLSYAATERVSVTVGQQDEPFSLADLSGSRAAIFSDAAAATALIPGDNAGVSITYAGDAFTAAGGIFGGDIDTGLGDEGTAVSGRITFNPTGKPRDGATVLHLGAAAAHRSGADFRAGFATGAGAGLLPRTLLGIGSFDDVERLDRANLELALRRGPAWVQAEATGARIDRGGRTFDASAAYLVAGYLLTGESRPYGGGTFGQIAPARPVPEGGPGAWAVALRADAADFEAEGESVRASAALNWHLTRALRASLDASYSETTDRDLGEREASILFLRLQYAH